MMGTATVALIAAQALWSIRQDAAAAAIAAATDALVEGLDGPALRELAGAWPNINVFELGVLMDDALKELGVATGDMTKDDAQLVAAYHYASQTTDGTLPLRELASWAHRVVGHEGHPIAQELVELDDAYDAYDGWGGKPDDAMQVVTNFMDAAGPEIQKWMRPGAASQ
ncbi:hypothetical protein QF015_001012 [Paenarthrobacter sp. TE4293]|uniref:hypothetical protein n=1 Tax=Paenarthrobacter sp. TE4293 TaxID=3381695 RepID=UPI003D1CF4CA